jgi:hypothetical protein
MVFVPEGQPDFLIIPGTCICLAWIPTPEGARNAHAIRFEGSEPILAVPGYYRAVPPGQAALRKKDEIPSR